MKKGLLKTTGKLIALILVFTLVMLSSALCYASTGTVYSLINQSNNVVNGTAPWSFFALSNSQTDVTQYTQVNPVMNNGYMWCSIETNMQAKPSVSWKANNSSGTVAVRLDNDNGFGSGKGQVAVCFTVPNDGVWKVDSKITNTGTDVFGGDGGSALLSVIKTGETTAPSDRSWSYYIPTSVPAQTSNVAIAQNLTLQAGDKIYLRVSCNYDGYADNFVVKHIITNVTNDSNASVIRRYDLSSVALRNLGQWSFYSASKYESNPDNYSTLLPTWGQWGMYVAYFESNRWATPYFFADDGSSTIYPRGDNIGGTPIKVVAGWTAPESGCYKVYIQTSNVGPGDQKGGDGGFIRINTLLAGSATYTTDKTITLGASMPSGNTVYTETVVKNLNVGDRIMLESDPNWDGWGDLFATNYNITKIEPAFSIAFNVGGTVKTYGQLNKNDVVNTTATFSNATSDTLPATFFIGLYEANTLKAVYPANSVSFAPGEQKTIPLQFTMPDASANLSMKAFIWSDFNSIKPLASVITN